MRGIIDRLMEVRAAAEAAGLRPQRWVVSAPDISDELLALGEAHGLSPAHIKSHSFRSLHPEYSDAGTMHLAGMPIFFDAGLPPRTVVTDPPGPEGGFK